MLTLSQILTLHKESGTYNDLDNYIKKKTKTTDGDGNDEFPITLTFDEPTFRVISSISLIWKNLIFMNLLGTIKKLTHEISIGVIVPNLTQDTDVYIFTVI